MAMTLAILYKERNLVLVAGFENGMCSVFVLYEGAHEWVTTYRGQAHAQPVLSVDVDTRGEYFLSSAADSLIVKHPIPTSLQTIIPQAAASPPPIATATDGPTPTPAKTTTGIGALFAGQPPAARVQTPGVGRVGSKAWTDPIKVTNTKHAGQQSLTIRSDGRVFATAGWDSKIRVYATKSLKELAVLQWHQVGVYATAFAYIRQEADAASSHHNHNKQLQSAPPAQEDVSDALVARSGGAVETRAMTVKDKRLHQAKHTHWLAAGAKDGKLSLWDIY